MKRVLTAAVFSFVFAWPTFAQTPQCTVPNTLTNGQVADATEVMDNFNAVAACVDQANADAVTHEGTPNTGEIAVFDSATGITGGDLTGDVTTSGSTQTELATTGVAPGTYSQVTVDAKGRVLAGAVGSGNGAVGLFGLTILKKSANQTFGSSWANVTWEDEVYDNRDSFTAGSNTWTVPVGASWMRINAASLVWQNTGGDRWIRIDRASGTGTRYVAGSIARHRNEAFATISSSWVPVTPGDTYRMRLFSSNNTFLSGDPSNFGGEARMTIEWAANLADLHD
ncbi:MAG: hypothetical protein AAF249_09500 [Pseudomonadota bacterium]